MIDQEKATARTPKKQVPGFLGEMFFHSIRYVMITNRSWWFDYTIVVKVVENILIESTHLPRFYLASVLSPMRAIWRLCEQSSKSSYLPGQTRKDRS